jgi:hypothetical protein
MVRVHAMVAARQEVKYDLKRQNCKLSHYASAEISKLAEQHLFAGNWARLEAQAPAKIMAQSFGLSMRPRG